MLVFYLHHHIFRANQNIFSEEFAFLFMSSCSCEMLIFVSFSENSKNNLQRPNCLAKSKSRIKLGKVVFLKKSDIVAKNTKITIQHKLELHQMRHILKRNQQLAIYNTNKCCSYLLITHLTRVLYDV